MCALATTYRNSQTYWFVPRGCLAATLAYCRSKLRLHAEAIQLPIGLEDQLEGVVSVCPHWPIAAVLRDALPPPPKKKSRARTASTTAAATVAARLHTTAGFLLCADQNL